ncbi:MAG: hypothetical protein AB1715_07885 [Acidobacteriota bacterium]
MEPPAKESGGEGKPILIDYDRIDVSQIMDQIKRRISEEARSEKAAASARAFPAPDAGAERGPGTPLSRGRMRRFLLKVMSPFRPLIKLLILPVYEEHREAVEILDSTNRRLDRLYQITQDEQGAVINQLREYTKLLHHLSHNLVVEITKLKIEVETLRTRVLVLEKDFESLGKREKALEQEFLK